MKILIQCVCNKKKNEKATTIFGALELSRTYTISTYKRCATYSTVCVSACAFYHQHIGTAPLYHTHSPRNTSSRKVLLSLHFECSVLQLRVRCWPCVGLAHATLSKQKFAKCGHMRLQTEELVAWQCHLRTIIRR